ncbi:MAP3K epsilon protein kinase 1 [Pelomyxa schiedti]|nr:MAP3K epsilon protein kinase 1 [Pelomyxa schiedti]
MLRPAPVPLSQSPLPLPTSGTSASPAATALSSSSLSRANVGMGATSGGGGVAVVVHHQNQSALSGGGGGGIGLAVNPARTASPHHVESLFPDDEEPSKLGSLVEPLKLSQAQQFADASGSGASPNSPSGRKGPAVGGGATHKVVTLGNYQLGQVIGRGACGVVYKAVDVRTGEFVAIKQFRAAHEASLSAEKEVSILNKLSHPNIIRVLATVVDDEWLNMVLEYADGGSLAGILDKFGPLPESLTAMYTDQILSGLDYLHSQFVLHRDIKGANILISADGTAKITDFGVSTFAQASKRLTVVGTPYWMSPETIQLSGQSEASDIWSVGATIIELLSGFPPYYEFSPVGAMYHIVQDPHPPFPPDISVDLCDFLFQCFHKEQTNRPKASALKAHNWLKDSRRQSLSKYPSVAELQDSVANFNAQKGRSKLAPPQPSTEPLIDAHSSPPPPSTDSETRDMVLKLQEQLKAAEKELKEAQDQITELKKTLRANASPEKATQEFFWTLAMSLKSLAMQRGQKCDANIQLLYEKANQAGIPWHAWIEWLPQMMFKKP